MALIPSRGTLCNPACTRSARQGGSGAGETFHGISDYALYRDNEYILAIMEAKRASIDPRLAETQAEFYVTEIEKWQGWRPFAFLTNAVTMPISTTPAGRPAAWWPGSIPPPTPKICFPCGRTLCP